MQHQHPLHFHPPCFPYSSPNPTPLLSPNLHQALQRLSAFTSDIQLVTSHLSQQLNYTSHRFHSLVLTPPRQRSRKPTARSLAWHLQKTTRRGTGLLAPAIRTPLPPRSSSAPPYFINTSSPSECENQNTSSPSNCENQPPHSPIYNIAVSPSIDKKDCPWQVSVQPDDEVKGACTDSFLHCPTPSTHGAAPNPPAESDTDSCLATEADESLTSRMPPPAQISWSLPTAAHQINQAPPPDQISRSPPTTAHQIDPPAVCVDTPPPDQISWSPPIAAHLHSLWTTVASRADTPNPPITLGLVVLNVSKDSAPLPTLSDLHEPSLNQESNLSCLTESTKRCPPITLDDVAYALATQAPVMTKKRKKKKQKQKSLPVVATEAGATSLHSELGLVEIDQCHIAPTHSPQLPTTKPPIKYTSEQLACLGNYLLMRHPAYVLLSIDEQGILLGKDINEDFYQQGAILYSSDGEFVFKREDGKLLNHLSIFDY